MSRMMSFPKQRVLFTFVIFGIAFVFTTSVLWGHIEKVIGPDGYQTLAKAGLILLPAVALIMTIWELFVDKVGPGRLHPLHPTVKRLVDWCFWGGLILLIAELVHSGAILKFESATGQQRATIAAVGDAQAKIAGASTQAAIESAGKAAQDLNAIGQRSTARRIVTAGKDAAAEATKIAQEEVAKVAVASTPTTFLPAWYVNGGMYVALPVLAALFFGITMALARQAAAHVDADDDGTPDAEQGPQTEYTPVTATQGGTEQERFQMAQGQWTRPPMRYQGHPISDAALDEIRARFGGRTQREIREDAPPRLPHSEWRRWADGWALLQQAGGKNEYQYLGFLDYGTWQELKESMLALPKEAPRGPREGDVPRGN